MTNFNVIIYPNRSIEVTTRSNGSILVSKGGGRRSGTSRPSFFCCWIDTKQTFFLAACTRRGRLHHKLNFFRFSRFPFDLARPPAEYKWLWSDLAVASFGWNNETSFVDLYAKVSQTLNCTSDELPVFVTGECENRKCSACKYCEWADCSYVTNWTALHASLSCILPLMSTHNYPSSLITKFRATLRRTKWFLICPGRVSVGALPKPSLVRNNLWLWRWATTRKGILITSAK